MINNYINNTFKNILFLDTETTGREAQDRIFQIAYDVDGTEYEGMFLPPVPLCIEAMEATHYTNKDVADKPPFQGSEMQKHLQDLLSNKNIILVAHNAPFDIEMLKRDNVYVKKYIDTLKIARYLDSEAKLDAYRLQYLRYALGLEIADGRAHDALGDVRVLKALFNRLFNKMRKSADSDEAVLDDMIEISSKPSVIHKITFGKYAGKRITDIAQEDPGYLQWLLKQKEADTENSHDQNEDWIYTLRKALEEHVS